MIGSFWSSLILGVSVGGAYALSSYLTVRFALSKSRQMFMLLVMGGTAARLFIAVLILALLMAFTSVDRAGLIAGFFASFVLGLIVEIRQIHRMAGESTDAPASNDSQNAYS